MNDGFTTVQVAEWLGHSSSTTTLKFYAHIDKTSKLAIANSLQADWFLHFFYNIWSHCKRQSGGTDVKLKKSEEKRQKKKSSKTACLSHFQGLVCGRGRRTWTLGTRFWRDCWSLQKVDCNAIFKSFLHSCQNTKIILMLYWCYWKITTWIIDYGYMTYNIMGIPWKASYCSKFAMQ